MHVPTSTCYAPACIRSWFCFILMPARRLLQRRSQPVAASTNVVRGTNYIYCFLSTQNKSPGPRSMQNDL